MLYRCFAVSICLATCLWSNRAVADDIPMPPRCGMYSIQNVSSDGRLISIAVATPTMFENGEKIPVGKRLVAEVFQSTDQGKSYSQHLEMVEGGSSLAKSNQPERLDAKVALKQPIGKDEVVFLAIRIRVGDRKSRMADDYLSFRNGDNIERFRSPTDAVASLVGNKKPASSIPRFRPSPQQGELIKQFGQPDFFEIAYVRSEDENGKQETDRLERWFYLSNRTEFDFFNGNVTATSEFEGAPQVQTDPLYEPSQFFESTSVSNARTVAVDGQLKQLNLKKAGLRSRLFTGVEMFLAKGIIVGFQDEELTYVRSIPNWPSQIPLDSTQKMSQQIQQPVWNEGWGKPRFGLQHRTSESSALQTYVMHQAVSPTNSLGLCGLSASILPIAYLGLPAGMPIGIPMTPVRVPPLRKVAVLASLAAVVAAGSAIYSMYGLVNQESGDIKKILEAGTTAVGFYTGMNEAIELLDRQNSALLESGNLSPAEVQRITSQNNETREALIDARNEIVIAQAALLNEAAAFGFATGISLMVPIKSPIVKIAASLFGGGITHEAGKQPTQITKAQFDRAVDRAESRINQFERNRYHEDQVEQYVKREWTNWDNQVTNWHNTNEAGEENIGKKMSEEERRQQFYDFIDGLDRDGWHVPQGLEKYAIDIIKTMPNVDPDDVPEQREPDEVIGIVATGKLNIDSVVAIENWIVTFAEKLSALNKNAPTLATVDVTCDKITLTISPDRRASISPALVNITLTDSVGKVQTGAVTLTFSDAYDKDLELTGDPIEGERLPVKKVRGTGKFRSGKALDAKASFNWTAEYVGYDIWNLTVTIQIPKDAKWDVPNEMPQFLFNLFEERK